MRAFVIGLLLLATAACSEPPQKEIDQAQSAIDAARAAGADQYAAQEYADAAATLQKAHAAIEQRDYRQALSYAIDARQRAIEASRSVADGRAQAKASAEAALKDVSGRVAHLESVLHAADAARVAAPRLRGPRRTLAAAQGVLQEARTALDARKFAEANALLAGVREKVDAAARDTAAIPHPGPAKARTGAKRRR